MLTNQHLKTTIALALGARAANVNLRRADPPMHALRLQLRASRKTLPDNA